MNVLSRDPSEQGFPNFPSSPKSPPLLLPPLSFSNRENVCIRKSNAFQAFQCLLVLHSLYFIYLYVTYDILYNLILRGPYVKIYTS